MNTPGVYKLFAYGSLRSAFKSHAYEYISRFFSFEGDGKVKGKLFDMGSYPAAAPADDGFIIGELYAIRNEEEFGWAIGQLDDYEGVTVEAGEIQLFRRELVDVIMGNAIIPAWIYWYNGSVEGKPVIESGDVIQYLQQKK